MIDLSHREQCCGCTSCATICPTKAITMQADALGFMYPHIDKEKCINCGLCEKACNFKKLVKEPLAADKSSQIYACRMKDMQEVAKSQSGGATEAIAEWILANGGVVYGAAFGEHFKVEHQRAENQSERDKQRGSKYVQSDIGNCFEKVRNDLKDGRYVLFTGTGCQVSGLLQYIQSAKIDSTKLYTCDLICHGVPSPKLWQDYVTYLEEKKLKKPITKAVFRDKEHYGWKSHKETFFTSFTSFTSFTYIFYDHIAFRPSCKICPYASTKRLSDFTVCDFWGYEKTVPEMGNDNKGLSLMFVSTEKAKKAFDEFNSKLNYKEMDEKDVLQPNMQHPTIMNINTEKFENDYINHGFEYIMRKYGHEPFIKRCKFFVKKCARKILGDRGTKAVKKLLRRAK